MQDNWTQGDVDWYDVCWHYAYSAIHAQTSNKTWEEEGGWGESKSGGLHAVHRTAAAACCVVDRLHFRALGREIVVSICHCCGIVMLCTQGLARCAIMRNQWLVVRKDARVSFSDQYAGVEAAGAARHWASPPCILVRPVPMVRCDSRWCNRPHAMATGICRYLQGQTLSHEKPITVPFPCRRSRVSLLQIVVTGPGKKAVENWWHKHQSNHDTNWHGGLRGRSAHAAEAHGRMAGHYSVLISIASYALQRVRLTNFLI